MDWKRILAYFTGSVDQELLPRSPNLNSYTERWVRSIKEEFLSKVILFGERSLRHSIIEYTEHYHQERNHQGLILQLPQDQSRYHYVKTRVRVHAYLDGTYAIFHGPRKLACYDASGSQIQQMLNKTDKTAA